MKIRNVNYANKLKQWSDNYRSEIITLSVFVEMQISQILTELFGTNDKIKYSVKTYLFSDTLTFEKKINLFNSLHKGNVFVNSDKSTRSDLKYLIKIRNFMAHSQLAFNDLDDLDHYDLSYLQFVSFTERNGEVDIRINTGNKEENPDKNVFSIHGFIERRENLRKNLDEIYNSFFK